jgi:hypothetical protein
VSTSAIQNISISFVYSLYFNPLDAFESLLGMQAHSLLNKIIIFFNVRLCNDNTIDDDNVIKIISVKNEEEFDERK